MLIPLENSEANGTSCNDSASPSLSDCVLFIKFFFLLVTTSHGTKVTTVVMRSLSFAVLQTEVQI